MATRVAPGLCRFAFSADLNVLVRCRVDRVLPQTQADEFVGDEPLDIEADLVLDGEVFQTAQSSQAVFDASPEQGVFRPQSFVFATKVRDLPRHCSFVFRLRGKPCRAGETARCFSGVLPLFNSRCVLRQGRQLLAVLPVAEESELVSGSAAGVPCERQRRLSSSSAHGSWAEHSNDSLVRARPELREALRLDKAVDLRSRGCLPQAAEGFEGSEDFFSQQAADLLEAAGVTWLIVQMPVFQHPVVFADTQYDQEYEVVEVPTGILSAPWKENIATCNAAALDGPEWLLQPLKPAGDKSAGRSFKCFVDYDAQNEHPALLKSLRLARSSRTSRLKDRDVRPNSDELRRLNELIGRSRRQFSAEEKHLLFRFRWSLTDQPGALTKFLHSVEWKDLEERNHAIEMLGHWAPANIDDALELLSKDFRGIREVRHYAVERLESATDVDLQLYLLQLVQALRYESDVVGGADMAGDVCATDNSPSRGGASAANLNFAPAPRRQPSPGGDSAATGGSAVNREEIHQRCPLMWFLIRRAVGCKTLATLFYWYVVVETEDRDRGAIFECVRQQLLYALDETKDGRAIKKLLERQMALRRKLMWSLQCAKINKRDRIEKKLERFRAALASDPPAEEGQPTTSLDLVSGLRDGITLPVDPTVSLLKIFPKESFLLKSAMNPGVLQCQVLGPAKDGRGGVAKSLKKIIVKEGDDLRQDQLILQLIILMDSILKKYGLDLQLTPYQVVALSTNDGFVEFVPDSSNISAVLKDHNSDIQQFFRKHHPYTPSKHEGGDTAEWGPHNSYGIKPEVLENFIRSSAGYCVITYILGIGDRHLDNLMVTKEGRLFHIDFGFILGKDPKPFPPPMRLCKEMVEGMGGNNSKGYESFKSKCCQAFKILRRHAKLIINLLYLMTDSGIKDLSGDPQFAILKVEQKFQETMDDENAEKHFLSLIEESVNAMFPIITEKLHQLAIRMQ